MRRKTILRLMCDLELDYRNLSAQTGVHVPEYFAREIASLGDLEADGLVQSNASGLKITSQGRLFIRNVAMRFDAYLPREAERRFSQTV